MCAQNVPAQEGEGMWAKEEEVNAEWRQLRNEKLHDLYFSPKAFRVTKSRRIRLVGRVAHMGEKRNPEFRWGILKERGHLEDIEVDRRIPFKLFWLRNKWRDVSHCGNEPSSFETAGNLLTRCGTVGFSRWTLLYVVSCSDRSGN
jgi:hypothetical protein